MHVEEIRKKKYFLVVVLSRVKFKAKLNNT